MNRGLRPRLLSAAGWSLAGIVFALAYTQAPLFTGNQNSKFLIGLARAGYGSLSRDWLANTTDPFPLFTALVRWTAAAFPPEAFYVYSVIFIGAYAYALVGIGAALSRIGRSRAALFVYFVLLAFIHSRLLGRLSMEAVGWNAPRLLHYGVADQYILGRVFQPSVFGVLLPLSVLLFLRGRPRVAALLLGAAAAVHPAYVFGAACLILAYAVVMRREGRRFRSIAAVALLALLPVAPVLLRDYAVLRPASPELWKKGMEILVRERIPHHALPGDWFGRGAALQVTLMMGAIVAVRRTRLFPLMLVPFTVGALLTIVQLVSKSNSLALLAPWRVSAFLVPMSTAVLLALPVAACMDRIARRGARSTRVTVGLAGVLLMVSVLAGMRMQIGETLGRRSQPQASMMTFVQRTQSSGEVYLVPPEDPLFMDFRLRTGAPVLVTWKSHPPRMDDEFLEWYARILAGRAVYAAPSDSVCARVDRAAAKYGITHVVTRNRPADPVCSRWSEVYRDSAFAVYRIR